MIEILKQPWPWYISGTIIGLMVPALLLVGNRFMGVSSSMRHICAACLPTNIGYFKYDWKKESWNLFFVGGILVGGFIAAHFLFNPNPIQLNPKTIEEYKALGIADFSGMMPTDIFNVQTIFSLKGLLFFVLGGFLVGFGTRYAGGCTSGHSIMGLSTLQFPSLVATICFMLGGIVMVNFILPLIFKLF